MTATTSAPDRLRRPARSPRAPARPGRRARRSRLPYLLLLPAVVLELGVHVIPMVVGVWMSLLELTQFHIRDWSTAPFVGLDNYRATLDVNTHNTDSCFSRLISSSPT